MPRSRITTTPVLAIFLLCLLLLGLTVVHLWGPALNGRMNGVLVAIEGFGAFGWVALTVAQVVVAVSGVLPASLLGVAAGAIYGVAFGFALSATGTLVGATLAFLISRSIFRPWVKRLLLRRAGLRKLDELLARDGWKLTCLIRVSPIMPFVITSYALGLSSIRLRDYLIGTLAALPALFGYVLIGALTKAELSAASGGEIIRSILLGVGAVATILLILRLGSIARRVTQVSTAAADPAMEPPGSVASGAGLPSSPDL